MKMTRIPLLFLFISFLFLVPVLSFGEAELTPEYPSQKTASFRFPDHFYVKVPTGATSIKFISKATDIVGFKLYEFISNYKNGELLADSNTDSLTVKPEWVGIEVYAMVSVAAKEGKDSVSNPMLKPQFFIGANPYQFTTKKISTAWVAVGNKGQTEFLYRSNAPVLSFDLEYTLQADKAAPYQNWARKSYFPRPSQGIFITQTSPFVIKAYHPATNAPLFVRANMLIQEGYHPGGDVYTKGNGKNEYKHEIIQFTYDSTQETMLLGDTEAIYAVTAGSYQPTWLTLTPYLDGNEKPMRVAFTPVSQDILPFTVEENGEMVGYEDAMHLTWKLGEKREEILDLYRQFGAKWRLTLTYNAFNMSRAKQADALKSVKAIEFRDAQGNVIMNPIAEKLPPFHE